MTLPIGSRSPVLGSGFTLVEVLVTIGILVAGVISLLRGYTVAIGAMETASEMLRADAVARAALAEIELQAQGPQGLALGRLPPRQHDPPGFQKSVAVSRVHGTEGVALYEVTVGLTGRKQQPYTWVTWFRGEAAP